MYSVTFGNHKITTDDNLKIEINGMEIKAEDIAIIGTEEMPQDEMQLVIRKKGWIMPIGFDEAIFIVKTEKDCTEGGAKDWIFSDGVEYFDTLWEAATTIQTI